MGRRSDKECLTQFAVRALSAQSVMQHYASFVGEGEKNTHTQVRLELQKSDNGCRGTGAENTAP